MCAVYVVAGGKGGVGRTTTTVNLGTALAGDGRRVVMVDADVGTGDLAEFVSLSPDAATLEDVLAEEASVGEATYRLAEGLFAVPGSRDLARWSAAVTDHLEPLVERLGEAFDVVLVDVGPGVSRETALSLAVADRTVLVTTPDPTAVRGAETTATLVDRADGHVAGTVCTRVRDEDPAVVVESLPGDLLAAVPEDDAVRDSVRAGVPVVAHAPDSPAAGVFGDLAETVTEQVETDRAAGDTATTDGTDHDAVARRVTEVERGSERRSTDGASETDAGPTATAEGDETAPAPDRDTADGAGTTDGIDDDVRVADLTDDDTDATDLIEDETDADVSEIVVHDTVDHTDAADLTLDVTVGSGERGGADGDGSGETVEAIDVAVETGGPDDADGDAGETSQAVDDDIHMPDLTDDDTDATDLIEGDPDADVSEIVVHGAGDDPDVAGLDASATAGTDPEDDGDGEAIVEPRGE